MFIGWNQWSKLRRFGESRQSFVAAQIEFSDNVHGLTHLEDAATLTNTTNTVKT